MDIYLFIFVCISITLFLWLTSKEGANCFEHLCSFNGVESSIFIPFIDNLLLCFHCAAYTCVGIL
jgi:hypothetical protein